jgi:hypothetical protein
MARFEELAGYFYGIEEPCESDFESWQRKILEHRVPDSDDDSEDKASSE